ncbi:phage repressor protein C with HTH and peptisase S24 domain [Acinetobacter calcoaceticus]|uniref:Phage repressor protein C with HTH and peptisase S24 domain n=1 Tax=Acinetobacter calcoaceticus TaxID=471 RepID=A0A4R1XGS3_ACICA|nr:phage repressor protein C with HTH and peptisase S24 domain [Acinetobacter calcoaceticus]
MSIQKNLKFLLSQRHLNANSLSEASEGILAQPTTRRILNGQSEHIRDNTLEKYAKFFEVELRDLRFGDLEKGATISPRITTSLQSFDLWDDETPLDGDDVELPYFKEVLFAAGSGATHVIEEMGRKLRFSKRTLKNAGVEPEFAACATNSGKSMENTISDGATLGIDKSKQVIKDGKIYAFDHGGMLRVKRLYRLPFGSVKLVSDNKEYEEEVLTAEQWAADARLLGWVFWWSTVDKW